MVLIETSVDGRSWKGVRGKLSEGYKWGIQGARRKNGKEREMGEMLMGIKKELWKKGAEMDTGKEG